MEFHSHRGYEPGDDLRRLNWQLYARQRKLFTKESRRELQRPFHIVLDSTASMAVAHGGWSKYAYAARIAAGLAQIACRQGDNPGLIPVGGNGAGVVLPPRSGQVHARALWAELARGVPCGSSGLADSIHSIRSLLGRRGFVLVLSDFLDQEERVLGELAVLRQLGHEVLALQVLDPLEVCIPKAGDFDFIDPESGERIRVSAEFQWRSYESAAAVWREELAKRCAGLGIVWHSAITSDPLSDTMAAWLLPR